MADDVLYAPEKLMEAVDGLVAGGNTMPPRDPNDDDDDAEDEDDDAEPDEEPAVSENPTNSAKPGRTPVEVTGGTGITACPVGVVCHERAA
jgi:hypothetical protein